MKQSSTKDNFTSKQTDVFISLNPFTPHDINDLCSVCLQTLSNTEIAKCKHTFCYKCITRWTQVVPNCPLCRTYL